MKVLHGANYRMSFAGPALSALVIGEVTPEKIQTARIATSIVERELSSTEAFQYMAIHNDRITETRGVKRDFDL